jgi:O-antigen/teichoic acid export membrane protein
MALRGSSLVVKFAMNLFIAKFMGFEILGLYGLVIALSLTTPSFLGLALMYTQSRRAVTQSIEEVAEGLHYYGRYLLLVYSMISLCVFIIGLVSGQLLLALLVLAVVFFEHFNNDLYQLQLNLSKPFAANLLHFIRSAAWMLIFMPAAFLFPVLRTEQALLTFWAIGGAIALGSFIWTIRHWPWKFSISFTQLRCRVLSELKESKVMYFNGLATASCQYLNHFLITLFLGLESTGVYVFYTQILSALTNLIQTGVIQFSRPKMVRALKLKDPAYESIYRACLRNTLRTAFAMVIVTLPVMYGVTFYLLDKPLAVEWFPVLGAILISFIVTSTRDVNSLIFYSHHNDKRILIQNVYTLSGLLLFNILCIPLIGLWAPAVSLIVINSIIVAVNYPYIQKQLEHFNNANHQLEADNEKTN